MADSFAKAAKAKEGRPEGFIPARGQRPNAQNTKPLLYALILFTVVATGCLWPLWSKAGWPQNHEYHDFVRRTQIYAAHFRFYDFFPIWSSVDSGGLGSPQPLLYHKLFYFLDAALYVTFGSIKAALITAIVFFLVIGAWGMYRLLQEFGCSTLACMTGGLALLVARYTVTDWLVRGAVAELTGYMLVPWTMLYLVRTVRRQRVQVGLGITLGLVFLAHSVLCFYLGLLYAGILLALIATRQLTIRRELFYSTLVALAMFSVLVVPVLLPLQILGKDYDVHRYLRGVYRPVYQFRPFGDYLWDRWKFGRTWEGLSVQIDVPLTILVIAGFAALFLWGRNRRLEDRRWAILKPALPITIILLVALILQLRITNSLYEHVPGLVFIQFPWRLLALITPAAIALGLYLVDRALPPRMAIFAIAIFGISMFVSSGAFAPIHYEQLKEFDPPLAPFMLSVQGEFIPKAAPEPPYTVQQVVSGASELGCTIENGWPTTEVKRAEFHIHCAAPAHIPLPVFASRAHRLRIQSNGGRPSASMACAPPPANFPALCGVSLPAGDSIVTVRYPTYPLFLKSLFSRPAAASQNH